MAEKELRKMRRAELVDIIYALESQVQQLQQKNDALERELAQRRIILNRSGSIAEAALALNGVFAAAQKAAEEYVASVQALADEGANPGAAESDGERDQRETAAPIPGETAEPAGAGSGAITFIIQDDTEETK